VLRRLLPWAALTVVIYAMALVGGFVETWGRDYTPTFRHYVKAFGVEWGPRGFCSRVPRGIFLDHRQALGDRGPLTAGLGILAPTC